jgi:polyhydroxybutyrate depolymerase
LNAELITGELAVGGLTRTFALRLPWGTSDGMPLMLVLHGNHPDATGQMMHDWSVSNGAFMAHRMALEASEKVAVLAAVAGGLPASLREIRPAHAVSAMLIHGTADLVSPLGGGYSRHRGPNGERRGRTLSLDETAGFWRAVDRCPPGPGDTKTTEFSSRHTAAAGVGGTRVASWTVFGGGHTWPGAKPFPGAAETGPREFDAAEEICRFAEPLLTSADRRRL